MDKRQIYLINSRNQPSSLHNLLQLLPPKITNPHTPRQPLPPHLLALPPQLLQPPRILILEPRRRMDQKQIHVVGLELGEGGLERLTDGLAGGEGVEFGGEEEGGARDAGGEDA